jgi:hypothetical protein
LLKEYPFRKSVPSWQNGYRGIEAASPYTLPALKTLAFHYEDAGKLEDALPYYMDLGFQGDVAYLLDVLMGPKDIQKFIVDHPKNPKKAEAEYALAVHLFRKGDYEGFEKWLKRAEEGSTQEMRDALFTMEKQRVGWGSSVQNYQAEEYQRWKVKNPSFNLVFSKRTFEQDLISMGKAIEDAPDQEGKAEALYKMATYLYKGSDLVFYNPIAWRGARVHYFNFVSLPTDQQKRAYLGHYQEHETPFRAEALYERVWKEFPKTSSAPKALYMQALANLYLRSYASTVPGLDFFGRAATAFGRIHQDYPKDSLAPDSLYWEAFCRPYRTDKNLELLKAGYPDSPFIQMLEADSPNWKKYDYVYERGGKAGFEKEDPLDPEIAKAKEEKARERERRKNAAIKK